MNYILSNWNRCIEASNNFTNLKPIIDYVRGLFYKTNGEKKEALEEVQKVLYENKIIPFKISRNGENYYKIAETLSGDLSVLIEYIVLIYYIVYEHEISKSS